MKRLFAIAILCILYFFSSCSQSAASPGEDVSKILDSWTSSHWGENCFVWLVHYPEELAAPWAALEASRGVISQEQIEDYATSFKKELNMDSQEPFLLSISNFSGEPLNIAPLSNRISLVDSKGKAFEPLSYDGSFDDPVTGSVRGLVFFSKQGSGPFTIVLGGLGLAEEGRFVFKPQQGAPGSTIAQSTRSETENLPGVIVVKPSDDPGTRPVNPAAGKEEEKEVVIEADTVSEPKEVVKEPEGPVRDSGKTVSAPAPGSFGDKDELISTFLDNWAAGDYEKMYSLLSEESRRRVSKTVFTGNTMQSPFRIIIMNGYAYKWEDENTAVATSSTELSMMRDMGTKRIRITDEGNGWKILW